MCELAVMIVDRHADDPYIDVKSYKSGDVIAIQEDNWPWTALELGNPDWRIVHLPKVTVSQALAFLAPEPETDPQNPSRMLQRRSFRLDLSSLTLNTNVRNTVDWNFGQLMAHKIKRPGRPDPNVL